MDSMMMTTKECLAQFVRASGINVKEGHGLKRRNAVCELFGIATDTGRIWFGKKKLPIGEQLMKIRLFLSLCGYEPTERHNLSATVRECADQVALSVAMVDEVAKYLGLSHDTAMRILTGKTGTTFERLQALQVFAEQNREKMEEKLEEWKAVANRFSRKTVPKREMEVSLSAPKNPQSRQPAESQNHKAKLEPLNATTSREVAVSTLSLMAMHIGLLEKVLAASGKEILLDGDLMRAIEIIIRFLKALGISPEVLTKLQQPLAITRDDPLFQTLGKFADLANGKEIS